MNREAQGIIIGLVVIAAILFFSSTRQTVVGTWTLNSVSTEYNSKNGVEGVDETERSIFSDLFLSDFSLSMKDDNTFDQMWVTKDGDTKIPSLVKEFQNTLFSFTAIEKSFKTITYSFLLFCVS